MHALKSQKWVKVGGGANFFNEKSDYTNAVDYSCKCCENLCRSDASPGWEDCLQGFSDGLITLIQCCEWLWWLQLQYIMLINWAELIGTINNHVVVLLI